MAARVRHCCTLHVPMASNRQQAIGVLDCCQPDMLCVPSCFAPCCELCSHNLAVALPFSWLLHQDLAGCVELVASHIQQQASQGLSHSS